MLNVHRNHKAYQGRGEVGGGGEIIYLSLHCHHQNDFCLKVGSDQSHLVFRMDSVSVRGKVKDQCPKTTIFKGELKRIQTEVFLLISLTARPNPAGSQK